MADRTLRDELRADPAVRARIKELVDAAPPPPPAAIELLRASGFPFTGEAA